MTTVLHESRQAESHKMFSILNEMADPAPTKTLGVVTASIGSAGLIYAVVAITGYLSFGDNVSGNVVGMCKSYQSPNDTVEKHLHNDQSTLR